MEIKDSDFQKGVGDSRLYLSGWFRHRILSEYLESENDNQIFLDVGGSTGSVSRWFRHQFLAIAVLDNDINALKQIHDSNLYPVLGDARCLPFKSDCFPKALSVDFQEHLLESDIPLYLNEVHRVLRDSGVMAVFTSCRGFTIRRWLYWVVGRHPKGDLDWADWTKDGHRNRLTASRHRKLVEETGFRLIRWRFYGHLFDPLVRRFHAVVIAVVSLIAGRSNQGKYLEQSYRNRKPSVWVEGYFWILKWVAYLDIVLFGRIPGGAVFMKLVKNGNHS